MEEGHEDGWEAGVMRRCEELGLKVRRVRRRGVMVELVPEDLAQAVGCGAEVLREVADAVGGEGVRHVALGLEEE